MTTSPNYERGFCGIILDADELTELQKRLDAQQLEAQGNSSAVRLGVPIYQYLLSGRVH